jgi:hypothetical protein
LRKRLWIFCVIAAILTAIALIKGILVLALFLGGLPGVILMLAPYALLICAALLVADFRSPQANFAQKTATALCVIGGVLVALAVLAAWSNRQIEQEVKEVTNGDHDLQGTLPGMRDIAIQFVTTERARRKAKTTRNVSGQASLQNEDATPGVIPPPTRKQFCERLCLHLLFNGLAGSVIVLSGPADEGDSAPDLTEIGMRFHLARAACSKPDIRTDNMPGPPYQLFAWDEEKGFAEEVSARMIAGQCVVGEPARLSDAQIIMQENPWVLPLHNGSNRPAMRNVLDLNLPPVKAARLSIYRVQDGNVEEVFRQTEVEAYPLLPVLLLGPVATGEGGIGITEGFLRRHRFYSEYKLRDVLKSKLGMDVIPITK